jgi:hypothetical protein
MRTVPEELSALLSETEFEAFHRGCKSEFPGDVRRFLTATMDEVRLSTSSRVALKVLHTIGIADAGKFREAVLRRELQGTIAYEKQRDHSSHTVYNYLLGWYFYLKCFPVREALQQAFKQRGLPNSRIDPFEQEFKYFGSVWLYASLLHDVGYMFEGSLSRMSFDNTSKQAAIGARVAKEYFNRTFWLDCDIELYSMRAELFKGLRADLRPPSFEKIDTLSDIADELRTIGNLDLLLTQVNKKCNIKVLQDHKPKLENFSGDAFDIWFNYYTQFNNADMCGRMRSVRTIFNQMIDTGLPDVGICLLDHGVCGGLLQLSASTYYYRLYAELLASKPRPRFADRFLFERGWSPAFWWTGIVWGTAAVALHNIQQLGDKKAKKLDDKWPGKLALSDDPLAYLGIIVDIVQEWNRYSVFKSLDSEPIQGVEVELGSDSGKVVLKFIELNSEKRAKKLRDNLDDALKDWGDVLEVRP